jgi:molybdopterin molybdotransferase
MDALTLFLDSIPEGVRVEQEQVPTEIALDRILAEPILAPHPLPPFDRSTVDGFAVRAADTFGASPSLPAYLQLIGEVLMGSITALEVAKGQAVVMHTGGIIPKGADAVVMVEDTQTAKEGEIEVLKAASVGQNVLVKGEDVQVGDTVLEAGRRLRPQEIGGLMALGMTSVHVARRPRVEAAQVRDVNSYTLGALVAKAGGEPILRGIIPDQYDTLLESARAAHAEDDVVVITAGSSVSTRDITADVIETLGEPGVLVHGVSLKPGKPTILAIAGDTPMIGLPGNPVSALVVAGLFVVPVIRRYLGLKSDIIHPTASARMTTNFASQTGREEYLPVRLTNSVEGWMAEPIYGRSNLIFTLVRADGLVRIPPEATGLAAGEVIEVILF